MKIINSIVSLSLILILFGCDNNPDVLPFDKQLAKDIRLIDEYLQTNGIDAIEDPTGLRYVIHEQGTGDYPSLEDDIFVQYEGRLLKNDNVFDRNINGVSLPLPLLIDGWRVGIPLLQEGGVMTLYIPSGLGYQNSSRQGIPANANLIFDVQLIEIR